MSFRVDGLYTRQDVLSARGLADPGGGAWYTGLVEHDGEWFIFCGVGTGGRTGHDYHNVFVDGELIWRGRTGSKADHPSIRALTSPSAVVHIFYREDDRAPFTYAGLGSARRVDPVIPVRVHWTLKRGGGGRW